MAGIKVTGIDVTKLKPLIATGRRGRNRIYDSPVAGQRVTPQQPVNRGKGSAGKPMPKANERSIVSWMDQVTGRAFSGMVTARGAHGCTIRDGRGRKHMVRHEHITDVKAFVDAKEHSDVIPALMAQGVEIPMEDRIARFEHPDQQSRANEAQLAHLKMLVERGAPIDLARVKKEATREEAQALIEKYGRKGRILLRKRGGEGDGDDDGADFADEEVQMD